MVKTMCQTVMYHPDQRVLSFKLKFADLSNRFIHFNNYLWTNQEKESEEADYLYSDMWATIEQWHTFSYSEYPILESLSEKILKMMSDLERVYPFLLK